MLFNGGRRSLVLLLCILAVVSGVFRGLRSEYIIFKSVDGKALPLKASDYAEKEQKSLYETVNKYQWPSVLAFYEQGSASFKRELETTIFARTPFAEPDYMGKKVKELDPSLQAVWIPNTLYELCVLHYVFMQPYNPTVMAGVNFLHKKTFDAVTHSNLGAVLDACNLAEAQKARFRDLFAQSSWWRSIGGFMSSVSAKHPWVGIFVGINECISDMLCNMPGGITRQLAATYHDATQQYVHRAIAAELIQRINKNIHHVHRGFGTSVVSHLEKELDAKQTLKLDGVIAKTLQLELAAQQTNRALLFRATAPISHSSAKLDVLDSSFYEKSQPRSVSYGNGLFAGALFDAGATPYYFMTRPDRVGYALTINKLEAAKNGAQNLFYISPTARMHELFERGEFFHPRTKPVMPAGIAGTFHGTDFHGLKLCDSLGLITTDRYTPAEYEAAYLRMLASNVVFLTAPTSTWSVDRVNGLRENMRLVSAQLISV